MGQLWTNLHSSGWEQFICSFKKYNFYWDFFSLSLQKMSPGQNYLNLFIIKLTTDDKGKEKKQKKTKTGCKGMSQRLQGNILGGNSVHVVLC